MGGTGLSVAGCVALLIRPNALAAPSMGTPFPIAVAACAFLVTVALSIRHLRPYWVGRLRASLAPSLALVILGLSSFVWLGRGLFLIGFWAAHLLDVVGVAGTAVSLAVGYRSQRPIAQLMAPVFARDPLVALVVATIESDNFTGRALDHLGRDVLGEEPVCGRIDALPASIPQLAPPTGADLQSSTLTKGVTRRPQRVNPRGNIVPGALSAVRPRPRC